MSSFKAQIVVGDGSSELLLGDNLAAMRELADEGSAAAVDLVYIDPPFSTGNVFTGRDGQEGYSDIWDSEEQFFDFLQHRLVLLRELMSDKASFYLHIDKKVGYLTRALIDQTIGRQFFASEITRIKCNPKNSARKAYGNQSDVIYFYALPGAIWNEHRQPLTQEEIEKQYPKTEEGTGRRYATVPIYGPGETKDGPTGKPWRGMMPPKGSHWSRPPAELDELDAAGRIEWSATGNPRKIIYADESPGNKIQDVWVFKDKGGTRDRYPTEKNLEMLELIVQQSSAPGSTVIDCFMGSGTTLVAAARHGRRFVGIDQNPASLSSAMHRLALEAPGAGFTVHAVDTLVRDDLTVEYATEPTKDGQMKLVFAAIHPEQGDRQNRANFVGYAHENADVWQVECVLAEKTKGVFVGDRPEQATHLLVVDVHGDISATPLAS